MALCDDIMIVFQHYKTFDEGKAAWNKRKARIDYNHIGYIFYVAHEEYYNEAKKFQDLKLKNSIIFTEDFKMQGAYVVNVPPNTHFAGELCKGKRYYEQEFDAREFVRRISE